MTHQVLGVRIHDQTPQDTIAQFRKWLHGEGGHTVVTPNPEFVLLAQNAPEFRRRLQTSDLSLPDGVGLRYAVAALTDGVLQHRMTGVDALLAIANVCAENGSTLLLFGGSDGSASDTANALEKQIQGLHVTALEPGAIPYENEQVTIPAETIESIAATAPVVLAVGLGQGKQEAAIEALLPHLPNVRIAIGVGGAFDTLSGRLPRAPEWMRRSGLEWLWRLWLEPRRVGRILRASVVFPMLVAWSTLKRRRFLKAVSRVVPELFRQIRGL